MPSVTDTSNKVGIIRHRKILRYPRSLPEKSDFMFLLFIFIYFSILHIKIAKRYLNAGKPFLLA